VPVFLLTSVVTILLSPVYEIRSSLGEGIFDWFRYALGPWGSWITLMAGCLVAAWLVWRFTLPASWRSTLSEIDTPRVRLPNLRRDPGPKPERDLERPVRREAPLKLVETPPKIAGEKEKPKKPSPVSPEPEPEIQEKKIRLLRHQLK
jgi:hypothetical protein